MHVAAFGQKNQQSITYFSGDSRMLSLEHQHIFHKLRNQMQLSQTLSGKSESYLSPNRRLWVHVLFNNWWRWEDSEKLIFTHLIHIDNKTIHCWFTFLCLTQLIKSLNLMDKSLCNSKPSIHLVLLYCCKSPTIQLNTPTYLCLYSLSSLSTSSEVD